MGKHVLISQYFWADQERVPRKGGQALIRRVTVTGGSQWKYLPDLYAGPGQEFSEPISRGAQVPDTVGSRQRCRV